MKRKILIGSLVGLISAIGTIKKDRLRTSFFSATCVFKTFNKRNASLSRNPIFPSYLANKFTFTFKRAAWKTVVTVDFCELVYRERIAEKHHRFINSSQFRKSAIINTLPTGEYWSRSFFPLGFMDAARSITLQKLMERDGHKTKPLKKLAGPYPANAWQENFQYDQVMVVSVV